MTGSGCDGQKRSRTKASASGFNLANGATFNRGMARFSFSLTEPSLGQNSGLLWHNNSREDQQYQQYHRDTGHPLKGLETYSTFQMDHNDDHGSNHIDRSQWNASPVHAVESEQMSSLVSQESIGAHAQKASQASSYDHSHSSELYTPDSQAPYISSSRSDITERSSPVDSGLYLAQQYDLQSFNAFPFPGTEGISAGQSTFQNNAVKGLPRSTLAITAEPSFPTFATADDHFDSLSSEPNNVANHSPISQDSMVYNPSGIIDPHRPPLWDENFNLGSQPSSPTPDWNQPSLHMMTSASNSPLECSPSLEPPSPRYIQDVPELVNSGPYSNGSRLMREPIRPGQAKVVSDTASRPQCHPESSEKSDESNRMVGRAEMDNNARNHPLYKNVPPKPDGLYHCPWEGQDGCLHKPDKLKCNYDKFVDSHLRPYHCKVNACGNSRFSSTACLLRHEREAHAMHGHEPYFCSYDGCERGTPRNGFPRHWNLRDHMKRVHNDPGLSPKGNSTGTSSPSNASTRSKKRKAEVNDIPIMEKVIKTVATSPVVNLAQEPTLVDGYAQKRRKLLEIVKQLKDPRDTGEMRLLRSANEYIKVMAQTAQTTQRINARVTLNSKQPPGAE